jgi:superfamily II DNA or RNA helicase
MIEAILENESVYIQDLERENDAKRRWLIQLLTQMCRVQIRMQGNTFGGMKMESDDCFRHFRSKSTNRLMYMFPRFVIHIAAQEHQQLMEPNLITIKDNHSKADEILAKDPERVERIRDFKGTLNDTFYQNEAVNVMVDALKSVGGGVLSLPPGFGKTVVCMGIISRLGLPSVILVHTKVLMDQWVLRLQQFMPSIRIGEDVQVIMIQKAYRTKFTGIRSDVGLLCVDEAHHICAKIMRLAVSKFNATYTLGLTATPERGGERSKMLYWILGPMAYRQFAQYNIPIHLHTIMYSDQGLAQYQIDQNQHRSSRNNLNTAFTNLIEHLVTKNHRVLAPVGQFLRSLPDISKRTILILCSRNSGVKLIHDYLQSEFADVFGGKDYIAIIGQAPTKRQQVINKINRENAKVMICTDKLVSEGFDEARIDTLIRVLPNNEGVQTYGRAMRHSPCKQLPVYFLEVCDVDSEWLRKMYERRRVVLMRISKSTCTSSVSNMVYNEDEERKLMHFSVPEEEEPAPKKRKISS